MDVIYYRGLKLDVIQSLVWEREMMFDQSFTTYECTRIRGSVIVSYNPGANSYEASADPALPPSRVAGKMPVETDKAIRAYLEQPRGTLIVESAGARWVRSPPTVRTSCDVRNGPFVRVNSIQHIPGERLWKIHLEFETYINEMPIGDSFKLAMIVSNRWSVSADVDWQHLTTRTYQGVCTFRGDLLRSVGNPLPTQQIDWMRSTFAAFGIPAGFQRTRVYVRNLPDGNSCEYTVVDTEQLWNKPANCPAVRIEVQDSAWGWTGSLGRAVAMAGTPIAMAATATVAAILTPANPGPNLIAAARYAIEAGEAVASNFPKYYKRCHVRVWGNQQRPRNELTVLALNIVFTRLGVRALWDTYTAEILIAGDTNNYVDVSYMVSWDFGLTALGLPVATGIGLLNNTIATGSGGQQGLQQWSGGIAAQSTTIPLSSGGNLTQSFATASDTINPPFPNGLGLLPNSGTRGTWPGIIVTQILENFNEHPAAVP